VNALKEKMRGKKLMRGGEVEWQEGRGGGFTVTITSL
jgi:hypothetical protein